MKTLLILQKYGWLIWRRVTQVDLQLKLARRPQTSNKHSQGSDVLTQTLAQKCQKRPDTGTPFQSSHAQRIRISQIYKWMSIKPAGPLRQIAHYRYTFHGDTAYLDTCRHMSPLHLRKRGRAVMINISTYVFIRDSQLAFHLDTSQVHV